MIRHILIFSLLLCTLTAGLPHGSALGQDLREPDLADIEKPISYKDYDIRNGVGFRIQLNNSGFGIGGEYRRVLTRYSKGIFEFQISGLKDEAEQTFQGFYGYTVIPNKYNRVLTFPALFGYQRRILPQYLSDNFRLTVHLSGGPAPAYVYPYFDHELFDLGFLPQNSPQMHYDVFQGWGDGEFIMGGAGHISIGANLGGDFGNIQTIRVGYMFHYYPGGIQIMEPNRSLIPDAPPQFQTPDNIVPAADKQSFFGSPHITFVFGTMW